MFKRNLSVAACVCLATMVVASAQTSYVVQVPGVNGTSTQIVGLGDDAFSRAFSSASGLAGAFQVLATPSGAKFFIVAPGGVQSAPAPAAGSTLLSPLTTISGIAGTVTSAAITPDGKYLLVAADHFYVINTSNNSIVKTDVGIPTGSIPVGIAVSRDSQTAFVLANINNQSALGSVNLTSFQTSQFLYMPYMATSVTLSPLGLLYVTLAGDQLYEIDPATLTITTSGRIQIPAGIFGPLRFTPDGSTAYSVNRNAPICSACASLLELNVATHAVSSWPAAPDPNNPPPLFDDVFVAGNSNVYAFSSTFPTTKLWDVTPAPLSVAASALGNFPNGPGLPINNVVGIAISNERPTARFLYLIISDSRIMRVNITAGNIDAQTSIGLQNGSALTFTPIPAQSGAANFFTLNRNLSVPPGGTSAQLIAQVIDSAGRPVMNVPVCFSTDAGNGLAITNASQITNADGWVQTNITAPSVAGTYTVTLRAGAGCPAPGNLMSSTFTITVGSSSGGGGASQITIYTGDAQLLRQANSTTQTQPLTVKLTNTDGTPIAGAVVTFAVTQGIGLVSPIDTASDENGLFRANFITGIVDQSHAFTASIVTASSPYGSVDFIETTHNASPIDAGQPGVLIIAPESQTFTIAQGDVIPAGIVAKTTSGHFPQAGIPIPNIGIRLAAPNAFDQSPVVSCQGSSRGNDQGVSTCNVIAACQPAGTLPRQFSVLAAVGEYAFYPMLVTVTQGNASRISIVSGNNQTGNPQSTFTLLAKVTDSCNQNVNGVTVNWAVTQGSASLSQVQTVSQNGTVSARVTLGATPGPVQVVVSGPNVSPVIFNLTTQVPVAGVSLVSGGGQSAVINQAFASPVVFVIRDTSGNPIPGLPVTLSVSGNATINPTSGTTNAQGQVQTVVTAGGTPGSITVTATYTSFTGTATLTSQLPGPQVTSTSFKNAASLAVGMTPCGLVTVTGNGLAPGVQGVVSGASAFGPLVYTLVGVSITVNNTPAPIQAVANQNGVQQVNFQAPCELTGSTATVVITVNGASTTVTGVPVFAVQPGIFTYAGPNNKPYGAVIRALDGSYVTPSNPARRGERYYMVATGLGQGTPTIITNSAGTGSQNVNLPIVVGVSDRGVPVLSARYLVGSIGAYLVEFQIPADAPTGTDQSLALAALTNNGTTFVFGNPVFLPGVI
ncbi:MAG: hypothetical protein JWO19_1801 [Bryobacterales bacterium]|nr:hypothetical protein [Bryobacterales bacterium]